MSNRILVGGVLVVASLVAIASHAGAQGASFPEGKYSVRVDSSVGIPMRDGVRLRTDIYSPVGAGDELPTILMRTPYNKNRFRRRGADRSSDPYRFAGHGYAVAVQDVRGRYESEGEYIVQENDTEDGYDAVSWIVEQTWSNGSVGRYGCSYLGETQVEEARMTHPNLMALLPQAAGGAYRWFGILNGGAIELSTGFGWFRNQGTKIFYRPPPGTPDSFYRESAPYFNPAPELPEINYREMWNSLPVMNMVERAGTPPTDWEDYVTHERSDPWWDRFDYVKDTDQFDVPALHVNSWFDVLARETLDLFNLFRTNAKSERGRDHQYIIMSPTTHCQSHRATEQTKVGRLDVGDARFDYYGLYLRWFDYWLKGVENGVTDIPKLQIYVMGRDEWRGESEWPLARTQWTKYYLHSDGRANSRFGSGTLSTDAPGNEPPDEYVFDPGNSVPSVGGPVCCTGTPDAPAGSFDQAEVETRNDVLVYTTPVLERGVEVTGPLDAVLYVSSDARDTDFTAKLVDAYPDGAAYNIQEGIARARYREGIDRNVWMEPGGVYEVKVDVQATSYYFRPGHRIRLEISSSNFPRFDRNMNTGGNNYDETEWKVANNVIHHSTEHPSHIVLPVIE